MATPSMNADLSENKSVWATNSEQNPDLCENKSVWATNSERMAVLSENKSVMGDQLQATDRRSWKPIA